MKAAAIDLGSNSFICLVFEFDSLGQLIILDDKIILTRLSEGVDQTKNISLNAMERSKKAFEDFKDMFEKHGVQKIKAVATSAARDSKNQKELLNLASKYKIPVEILSGDQEARLTYAGVRQIFQSENSNNKNDDKLQNHKNDKVGIEEQQNQNGLIIDIGGGSTEYILVQNGEMVDRISLDMGVVRFTERYAKGLEFKDYESKLRLAIKNEISKNEKLMEFKKSNLNIFLAVSGTPTTAASILVNGLSDNLNNTLLKSFDVSKIEGFEIHKQDFNKLYHDYCSLKLDQRLARYPYVEEKRADVLPTGILILEESLNFFKLDKYIISTRGIRHGLAYSMYNDLISC